MQILSILVVDDDPTNFEVIEAILTTHEGKWNGQKAYQLHYANSGRAALEQLSFYDPDLILLDVMMPDMDGIAVCQTLKSDPQWQTVPIIMATALTEKQDLARCLAAGADDFISKPLNSIELSARVQSMLRIRHQQKRLETFNAQLEAKVQERTAALNRLIMEDSLTGLPSRTGLLRALTKKLEASETSLVLVYIDCHHFQLVRNSLGYEVSDQLLQAIAQRLKQHLRADDLLARIGEDMFCVVRSGVDTFAEAEPLMQTLQTSFEAAFSVGDLSIYVATYMGIALEKSLQQGADNLLQAANTAVYHAKHRGRGAVQNFDPAMHTAILNRLTLENDLQRALEKQEFITYYQPIINLDNGQIVGMEALVRWQHPERGMVSPGEFIPCMEATGLIVPVGLLVLEQACEQLRIWHDMGYRHLTMSVNLSVRQFSCPTLITDINRVLKNTGVNPACLKLEITESAIMDNPKTAIAITQELRAQGLQISIDDFGTGYSSLAYLHRFPVDVLKIDRSFVNQIQADHPETAIVDIILALSRTLKISTIAEGIETAYQLEKLKCLGCGYGQGYLFSRPLPAAELETKLCLSLK
ncbi:MAG: EAL domain-containing protein [Synechococcus sp.]|nr:EAL domain-containing protein [Synechococcus sp.]